MRQYGTDKEKALLLPLDDSWGKLAARMAAAHICCSTFHFASGNFVDLASQGIRGLTRTPNSTPTPTPSPNSNPYPNPNFVDLASQGIRG